jgi:hypothetical protein
MGERHRDQGAGAFAQVEPACARIVMALHRAGIPAAHSRCIAHRVPGGFGDRLSRLPLGFTRAVTAAGKGAR